MSTKTKPKKRTRASKTTVKDLLEEDILQYCSPDVSQEMWEDVKKALQTESDKHAFRTMKVTDSRGFQVIVTTFNITDARLSMMGDEQECQKLLFQYNSVRKEMTVYGKLKGDGEWMPVPRQAAAQIIGRGPQTLRNQLSGQLGF